MRSGPLFRRTAALAQNHHETWLYRRLFSVYSDRSTNANDFRTFRHVTKRRPEWAFDPDLAILRGKLSASPTPPLPRFLADSPTRILFVPFLSPLVRWTGRHFFQPPGYPASFDALVSYLRTNTQAISYEELSGSRRLYEASVSVGGAAELATLASKYAVLHEKNIRLLRG
jgi:hypothetical protein